MRKPQFTFHTSYKGWKRQLPVRDFSYVTPFHTSYKGWKLAVSGLIAAGIVLFILPIRDGNHFLPDPRRHPILLFTLPIRDGNTFNFPTCLS